MTDNNIILPVITHLFTAVILIFLWQRTDLSRYISVIGNLMLVGESFMLFYRTQVVGVLVMQAGNWPAPFGITFVSDALSSTMVLLSSLAGLAVTLFSTMGVSKARMQFGYFPMLHFLLMGLNGAFLTGDIFNLYVWFEIIIISSFVLMTLGGRKPQIEGGIKYVVTNLLASMIFLTGIAILYGLTGSLNMADLSQKVAQLPNRRLADIAALLFLVAFGIKSAVFPLYLWLPSSYHTPPSAIAAIFGGLLTKVGVYALLRVFTLIFVPDAFVAGTLMVVATATLMTGALGAIIQKDVRRILSYLIVSHIGYMIAGLALFTETALTGALFYLFHDMVVKTNLFLVSGLIYKIRGTVKLAPSGGFYAEYPKLSLLMALVFFSMVGIPPLSGFWPKIYLLGAAFSQEAYVLAGAVIAASFLTLYLIARVWAEVFWKQLPPGGLEHKDLYHPMNAYGKALLVAPVVLLAVVSLFIGLGAESVARLSGQIARELLDPAPYVEAVMGEK